MRSSVAKNFLSDLTVLRMLLQVYCGVEAKAECDKYLGIGGKRPLRPKLTYHPLLVFVPLQFAIQHKLEIVEHPEECAWYKKLRESRYEMLEKERE